MTEHSEGKRQVLVYACSGAVNVAEVADLAARQVHADGCASMFCLAGLGAGIEEMIETARGADLNVVIDGCPMDCAKRIFDNAGLSNYVQIKVTDLGIAKSENARATDDEVEAVAEKVRVTVSTS